MNKSCMRIALVCGLAIGIAAPARAGAPQPDTRQGEFAHRCQGGPNKGLTCTVPTQAADCPKSACVVQTLSKAIRGTMTVVAHDAVTDWLNGGASNQALTVMLEVKAPDGSRQMLAATYQDLLAPTDPPQAPGNVLAISMDEAGLALLAADVSGLRFVQPEATLSARLQELFATTGTPVIIAANARRVEFADHSADGLASVVRFKVKIQFVEPL
jgi:hypothetical protein